MTPLEETLQLLAKLGSGNSKAIHSLIEIQAMHAEEMKSIMTLIEAIRDTRTEIQPTPRSLRERIFG